MIRLGNSNPRKTDHNASKQNNHKEKKRKKYEGEQKDMKWNEKRPSMPTSCANEIGEKWGEKKRESSNDIDLITT